MKIRPIPLALIGLLTPLAAQEATSKWNVELPPPLVVETPAESREKPAPIQFNVRHSRTFQRNVQESPPMPGLPPVTGTINVTVSLVDNPRLPDPPPRLPALPPTDPAVIAQLRELKRNYRGTEMAFISASVYNNSRTLLRIYPNGQTDQEVIAWSNLNFLHFSGHCFYRVHFEDGTFQDYGLLMAVSNTDTDRMQQWVSRSGNTYRSPEIPELPDLAEGGPAFIVLEGDGESRSMDILEQTHDLYATRGKEMEEAFIAREKATAEKRAYLLANPPAPKDVKISFWNRNTEQARDSKK